MNQNGILISRLHSIVRSNFFLLKFHIPRGIKYFLTKMKKGLELDSARERYKKEGKNPVKCRHSSYINNREVSHGVNKVPGSGSQHARQLQHFRTAFSSNFSLLLQTGDLRVVWTVVDLPIKMLTPLPLHKRRHDLNSIVVCLSKRQVKIT